MTQSLVGLHFGARSALGADFWLRFQCPWLPPSALSPILSTTHRRRDTGVTSRLGPVSFSGDCPRRPWAPGCRLLAPGWAESGLEAVSQAPPLSLSTQTMVLPYGVHMGEPWMTATMPLHGGGGGGGYRSSYVCSSALAPTPRPPALQKHRSGKPTQPRRHHSESLYELLQLLFPEPHGGLKHGNVCSHSSGPEV